MILGRQRFLRMQKKKTNKPTFLKEKVIWTSSKLKAFILLRRPLRKQKDTNRKKVFTSQTLAKGMYQDKKTIKFLSTEQKF